MPQHKTEGSYRESEEEVADETLMVHLESQRALESNGLKEALRGDW